LGSEEKRSEKSGEVLVKDLADGSGEKSQKKTKPGKRVGLKKKRVRAVLKFLKRRGKREREKTKKKSDRAGISANWIVQENPGAGFRVRR